MACRLPMPSHFLNQYWNIVNRILRNKLLRISIEITSSPVHGKHGFIILLDTIDQRLFRQACHLSDNQPSYWATDAAISAACILNAHLSGGNSWLKYESAVTKWQYSLQKSPYQIIPHQRVQCDLTTSYHFLVFPVILWWRWTVTGMCVISVCRP